MNNDEFKNLINKSKFFNKSTQQEVEIKTTISQLVKLNIASGPNIFPFDGWINYDKDDSNPYFKYLDWQDEAKTRAYILDLMPPHQQELAKFIRTGAKIDFRVQDINTGFPQHHDNSVDLIYLGQMIEHFNPIYETPKFLNECFRMLKPGGVIRITTPDLDVLLQAFLNGEMNKFENEQPDFYKSLDPASQLALIMYGASGPNCTWKNYEGHMFLFTKTSMFRAMKDAGFKEIEFYYTPGKSKNEIMAKEVVDAGLSHSFICEATK